MKSKKGEKRGLKIFIFSIFLGVLIISFVSAGFFSDVWRKITGAATNPSTLNITIGAGTAPNVTMINNHSVADLTLSEGGNTNVSINFSAWDAEGATNLNDGTAWINITKNGEAARYNLTCVEKDSAGNYANYSCIIMFWSWDGDGEWLINATISDNSGLNGSNNSTTNITIKPITGFNLGPSILSWGTINPGSKNQTPSNFMMLNNTGNQDMGTNNITVNATNLMGETTDTEGLYSGNFTVSNNSAGTSECDLSGGMATPMNLTSGAAYEFITGANLSRGNYTKNGGIEGQEQLYFCLTLAGSEISSQSYSTHNQTAWTVQISQTAPA